MSIVLLEGAVFGWWLMARTLVLEDYPDANLKWCQSQDVQFMVGPHTSTSQSARG